MSESRTASARSTTRRHQPASTRGRQGPKGGRATADRVRRQRSTATKSTARTNAEARRAASVPFVILLTIVVCLSLLGLTMVLSASSVTSLTETGSPWGEFTSQLMWLVIGTVVMTVGMFIDHNLLRRLTLPGLLLSLVLLVGVLIPGLGVSVNGAQRWIRLGPLQFQPSEMAKLALVLYASHVLAKSKTIDMKATVKPIVTVLILFGGLILLQPNLGTTIIMFSIGLSILFASGVRLWVLALLGSVSVTGATLLAYFAEYRRARLLAFLDPWADPLNQGWQTIQSLVSVANGGVTGVGIGASRGKYGFLPEAHNDFIFAVTAEEFGLVGAVVVILGYVFFGITALVVARRADRFGSLLVVGISTWILVQAFINIGAVLGVMPITGVPLPFMSAGGTSLVTTMAGIGVMLNVARSIK
jgi:cell division protein FtsW